MSNIFKIYHHATCMSLCYEYTASEMSGNAQRGGRTLFIGTWPRPGDCATFPVACDRCFSFFLGPCGWPLNARAENTSTLNPRALSPASQTYIWDFQECQSSHSRPDQKRTWRNPRCVIAGSVSDLLLLWLDKGQKQLNVKLGGDYLSRFSRSYHHAIHVQPTRESTNSKSLYNNVHLDEARLLTNHQIFSTY